jgi:hypothetical protein
MSAAHASSSHASVSRHGGSAGWALLPACWPGLLKSTLVFRSFPTSRLEERPMHNHGFSPDEQLEKFLLTIDWVQRTGWPTRAHDLAVATRAFDKWWHLTEPTFRSGESRDRRVLLEDLAAEFSATYDREVAEQLCAMFTVVFDSHIRSREETAGSRGRARRPWSGDGWCPS